MTVTKRIWLRQVTLERPSPSGSFADVFWIQEEFARVGRRVVDEDGVVWTVCDVHGRSAVDDLDKRMAAWRRWRDVLG